MSETKVPTQLKKIQQWFGSIIDRPIDEDSRMNSISPSGESMEIEAAHYICPSPTLRPAQRIQIYNQQYWWRLLNTLHEIYPTLFRIFGYYDFNKNIGIPYITQYRPKHWSLVLLGDHLSEWIDKEYPHSDKEFIHMVTQIDWAFNYNFIVEELPQLTQEELIMNDNLILILQPSVSLFKTQGHLFKFREDCLEYPPEHWHEHGLPKIEKNKTFYFILYRNNYHNICWKELSSEEYQLLNFLQSGKTINQMCDWLEEQESSLCQTAMSKMQEWFHEWTARNWLSSK